MSSIVLRLQKNVFWLALVGAILLGVALAYSGATIAGMFLSEAPTAAQGPKGRNRVLTGPANRPFQEYEGLLTGNLFQSRRMETAGAPGQVAPDVKDIVLHGVLAGSRSFARAIIQVKGEGDIREYAIAEAAGGNRILDIYGYSILIDRGGSKLELQVGQDTSTRPAPPPTPGTAPGPAGSTKITVQRSRIIALTQDPVALSKAKVAPVTVGNQTAGMKLISVPPDSIFFELGARSGDIIRRINGQPLSSAPEKMLELLQGLKTLDRFTVEVERSGRILPYEILIQN